MPTVSKSSRGFTLFELLIVVLLIAVLYGVFISKMSSSPKKEAEKVTLETLKKTLDLFPAQRSRELICTDPCTHCRVYIDGSAVKGTEVALFKKEPTVWVKDRYGQFRQKTFLPLNDPEHGVKNVCFRYKLYRNGSGSSYIVQTDDKHYYVFKPYLHPVSVAETLTQAQEMFDTQSLLPTERRDYNF